MNLDIANYPKPYIALCSGVIMGGGMGISAHGTHMVVTEDAFASMPEMNIGYITDVGMSWLLQNLPKVPSQSLGTFLGLTGYRLSPDDMLATGLATHKVSSLDGVLDGIIEEGPGYLDTVAVEPGESQLLSLMDVVGSAFHGPWAEIQARLDGELAELVAKIADAEVQMVPNPRKESAENELHVVNDAFLDLGLEPTKLEEGLLMEVEDVAKKYADRVDRSKIPARSLWTSNQSEGVPQGEK